MLQTNTIDEKDIKQIGFGEFNVKFAPGDVPEKYEKFVTFDNMSINVRYQDFNVFDLSELVKIDKLQELSNKSGIALMLQVNHLAEYLMDRTKDSKGFLKSSYFYDLFNRFYGFSKTFVKTCLQVYRTFWVYYYHPLYLDFSFSQLVEMLPLSKADMQQITADWSVRRIRAYKKELQEKKKPLKKKKGESEPVDEYQEILETDIQPVGVKSSYVISVLNNSYSSVMVNCKYKEKTTSYKIFQRAMELLIKDFAKTIKLDNSFIQE